MADEENQQEYQLINEAGETVKKSYGYSGKGVATYPNGDVYDGPYVNGQRHGENGTYKFNNKNATEEQQDMYRGEWSCNSKSGIGKMIYVGKGTYYGYWENDERNGEGVMTYVNQDVYSGNWKNGKKHGQGTYVFFETGMKFVGKWNNGQMAEGEWKYPNGTKFIGRFDNNQPKGKGKWTFENGNVVEGEYNQTRRADMDNNDIRLAWKTTSDITKAPAE